MIGLSFVLQLLYGLLTLAEQWVMRVMGIEEDDDDDDTATAKKIKATIALRKWSLWFI